MKSDTTFLYHFSSYYQIQPLKHPPAMKIAIQLLAFLLFSKLIFAQNANWEVKGKVVDMSNMPVPFANIYVNNTSIGTATNQNGTFALKIPISLQKIEIIVSFVGYQTLKIHLSHTDPKLTDLVLAFEKGVILNEVKVTAKPDKYWKIFKRTLLGESPYSKDCEILNPAAIQLEYTKERKLVATANEPIIIKNNALGQTISFQMEKFETDGNQTFFSGDKFFRQDIPNSDEQFNQWTKNRKNSYHDSFRRFLVSLSQNKLQENGFVVFEMYNKKASYLGKATVANEINNGVFGKCNANELCSYDAQTQQFMLFSDYPLIIFNTNRYSPERVFADYPNPYSVLELKNNYSTFTINGWLAQPNGIIIQGYWGKDGFANLLPDDYFPDTIQPTESEEKLIENEKIEASDAAFIACDYNIKITKNDYDDDVFALLKNIPNLKIIRQKQNPQLYFTDKTNTHPPVLLLNGQFIEDEINIYQQLKNLKGRDIQTLGIVKNSKNKELNTRKSDGIIVITTNQ